MCSDSGAGGVRTRRMRRWLASDDARRAAVRGAARCSHAGRCGARPQWIFAGAVDRGADRGRTERHRGSRPMKVTVNDEAVEVDEQTTVAALVESLGFPEKGIAVAVDWSVLPRSEWETALTDGARVEVVTAVQGG